MRDRRTFLRMLSVALSCALVLVLVAPSSAGAILRSDILVRAQVWVTKAVPYSQYRFANVDGVLIGTNVSSPSKYGYRTDCSGFVSMCLGLTYANNTPKSLDTASLRSVLTTISKDDLKPGDVILRPKDLKINGDLVPYGHAVIFGGWTDATKKSYVGYDESSGSNKAVRRVITYPFWGSAGFSPYRYKGVEDVRYKKSRPKLGYKRDPLTGRVVPIGS